MVNWLPIMPALVGIVPAAALFFISYGRYDGSFRDNVVFLYFIGGLILGAFLGFAMLFILSTNSMLAHLIGLPLLLPVAILACANRRKWQGERHAVFNGGALGLGVAVMMSFTLVYFQMRNAVTAGGDPATVPFELDRLGRGLLVAVAFAGLFFGLGLLMGDAVRRRVQLKAAFAGAAIVIAPAIILLEFVRSDVWLWGALLAIYGAVFAFAADRKLLIQGVDEVARKARRRARRKAQ